MVTMQRSMHKAQEANKATNGSVDGEQSKLELDAVVIGGGFGGVYLLHKLRTAGFNVKLIEAGTGLGGIWHWNNCMKGCVCQRLGCILIIIHRAQTLAPE